MSLEGQNLLNDFKLSLIIWIEVKMVKFSWILCRMNQVYSVNAKRLRGLLRRAMKFKVDYYQTMIQLGYPIVTYNLSEKA